MKKYFEILFLCLFLLPTLSSVKAQNKKSEDRSLSEILKLELNNCRQNTILPVILRQRQKMELTLTAADKADIQYLRNFLKPFRNKHKSKSNKKHYTGLPALKKIFSHHVDELEIAINLVEKHHEQVLQLNDEISTDRQKWTSDRSAIFEKYGKTFEVPSTKRSFWKCLGFILLDPSPQSNQSQIESRSRAAQVSLAAFPNPASSTATLSFAVPESGNILLEIVDLSGKKVKTCFDNFLEAGSQQLLVDLREVPNGTYAIVFSAGKKKESIQIVVAHE